MNILVTGANGQLGNEMRVIAQRSGSHSYFFTDVCDASPESEAMLLKLAGPGVDCTTHRLDITDISAVRAIVNDRAIDAIVNCAAYTNVDAAESNLSLAELLNATAPQNLAVVMKEAGGVLVHISTDYVFGKEPYNVPCREEQQGTPTGVYGLTKLQGEQNILATGCRSIIIRTGWLYSEFGKNFCRTMLSLTASKPHLKVVFDQVGTPTYAGDLASAIAAFFQKMPLSTGVFHFSNEGVCSWYDFARMIAEYSGQTACDIQPCHSDEFPSPVRRPSYSVLDKTLIKKELGLSGIPYWTESLKKCIANLQG